MDAGDVRCGWRRAIVDGERLAIRQMVECGLVWSMNGVAGRTADPMFRVARGRTVVMPMINDSRWPHAMHIHGHHFRVIESNGQPREADHWRDTVLLEGGERATVAFVADNPGKWMIHCHMLEHQAAGMATWFQVDN